MVTIPYRTLRRRISLNSDAVSFAPGTPQRMPQSDGSSIHIRLFRIKSEFANHRQRLRSKCLIEFDQSNVFQLQSSFLQRHRHGVDRPDSHLLWQAPCNRIRNQPRNRLNSKFPCPVGIHQHRSSSAI